MQWAVSLTRVPGRIGARRAEVRSLGLSLSVTDMSRGSATQRGYGYEHQRLRKRIKREVDSGTAVCWRCGVGIDPLEQWHLGHDDDDPTIYRGAEHAGCNLATATPGRGTAVRRRITRAIRTGTHRITQSNREVRRTNRHWVTTEEP